MRSVRWGTAAVLAAGVLALAACGSSSDEDGGGGGGTTAASTAAASTTGAAPADGPGGNSATKEEAIKTAAAYTGATPGAADDALEPIGIGWANQDSGPVPLPALTRTMRAAFAFINDELGGVNGHPLKLIESRQCVLGAAEKQGTLCAQSLINDPDVDAVVFGYAPVGGRAFLATMAESPQIPVIGAVPLSPTDFTSKSSFFTSGGPFAVNAVATFMSDVLKAKSAAEIFPDDPANAPFVQGFIKTVESVGVKVTTAYVPPDATDVLGAVTAAGPTDKDVVGVNAFVPGQCVAEAQALKTLGAEDVPTITIGSICLDPSVKEQLGDYPKFIYSGSYPNVDIADPTGQTGTMWWALNEYDAKDADADIHAFYAPQYFGIAMQLQKWLAEVGDEKVDTASLGPVILKFTGQIWGGADDLKFGQPGTPAIASFGTRFSQYEGDGQWKYVSGWLKPPPPAS